MDHRLNMELYLQSLFGHHVHLCTAVFFEGDPQTPPPFPHLGSYTRTLFVTQDRWHLFVSPVFCTTIKGCILRTREYWMICRGPGILEVSRMIWLLPYTLPPSPVRKWPLFLNLPVYRRWSSLKGEGLGGGGGGDKSYGGEEALFSINHSKLFKFFIWGGGGGFLLSTGLLYTMQYRIKKEIQPNRKPNAFRLRRSVAEMKKCKWKLLYSIYAWRIIKCPCQQLAAA
jgi:hypothetical protein